MTDPVYLGDGLWADNDGWHIVLTANRGAPNEQVVYLEPAVWDALTRYVNELRRDST